MLTIECLQYANACNRMLAMLVMLVILVMLTDTVISDKR
jgi:hypothetical protein